MSNLIEELQNGLKENKELFLQIKNEEIMNLIENYKESPYDYKIYEMYFNNKCKKDYITYLLSYINNMIEKTLKNDKSEILEKKIVMLFQKYKGNMSQLMKQFNINKEDMIKNIKELKELKEKIDIKKELKSDIKKEQEKYNDIKNNIEKIIIEQFEKYLENGEKSELLNDFIKYLVKINNRLINMKVSSEEYNKYLINKLTEDDYNTIDDIIDNNVTFDYIDDEQLSLMIIKYKNIKNETLEGLILEFPDEIDVDFIKKYRTLDTINEDKNLLNNEIKYHLLIEIMEICQQPKNEKYIKYLKNIYIENGISDKYDEIIKKNKEIKEMLIEYEDDELTFTKEIIKKIKNKEDYKYDILKKSINEDMTEKEYYYELYQFEMIENLIVKEEVFDILDSYVTRVLSNRIQEMVQFNLSTNIKELKKNLKESNDNDKDIREQLREYEIIREKKKNYIYVSVNDIYKNNNIIDFFNFYRKLDDKLKLLNNEEIMIQFNKIIQNTISQILQHYLKAITHYKTLENESRLYYNLNEDEEIRVYVKDEIMSILEYILKNLNSEGEFIFKHIMKHIFEYEYYNTILEIDETISDKLYDDILIVNYSNKINLINNVFGKNYNNNDIKKLNKRLEQKMQNIIEAMKLGKKYKSYYAIYEANKDLNILTEKELKYLKRYWDDLSFLNIKQLVKKNNKKQKIEELTIEALNFIKLFVNEVDMNMKMKKINVYNDNNKNEVREQNEIIKELKRLMGGEMKMLKSIKPIVQNVYINNVIDIESKIEDFDLSDISIKKFQKMYNNSNNNNVKEKMIKDSIDRTIQMLDKMFSYKYLEKDIILKTMLSEKNRLIVIAKRNTRNLDYKNIYERINKEQKNLYDIVKFITILYYLDSLINKDIDIEKQLNIDIEKPKKMKLINKKIYIIKTKKITKIKKEINGKYKTIDGDEIDRFEFILLDTLKNKMGKIINGVFKGKYARIINIKELNYFKKQVNKNKLIESKYYNDLIKKLEDKIMKMKNISTTEVYDEIELSSLEKYRKSLKINNLDDKYYLNIKINPRLNKIISDNEIQYIREFRSDRIKEMEYQIMIYTQNMNEKKEKNIQYMVRINEGDKNQKNVLLNKEDININTDGLVTKEIIEIVKNMNNKKINKFKSIYDLIKYLFEYQNLNIDNKLEHFTNLYKEGIEIFNYNKVNKMNKILIEQKLNEKIRKMSKNIQILTKKLSKNKIKDNEKVMLQKLKRLINTKKIELQKIKLDIESENLYKYYNIESIKKQYIEEIDIINSVTYFKYNEQELKYDLDEIKKIKIQIKQEMDKESNELKIEISKIIAKFKEELEYLMNQEDDTKMKLIKFIRYNVLDIYEEDDGDIDIDELEAELDNIFKNENKVEKKNQEMPWIEMDDESYEFSDDELSGDEI